MATPPINVILQAIAVVTNNQLSPAPQIVSFDFNNPTMGALTSFYNPNVTAVVAGTTIPLPVSTVFGIFVQNLSPTGVLEVVSTPVGYGQQFNFIGPGGLFIVFDAPKQGNGFQALQLFPFPLTGTCPAAVLVVA